MNDTNNFENTVLVLVADHGSHYGKLRRSEFGSVDHHYPLLEMFFPPSFDPVALSTLGANENRLITAYDIHATVKHLITYPQPLSKGSDIHRADTVVDWSYSLFEPIPANRTCVDAHIGLEYCGCLRWNAVQDEKIEKQIAEYLLARVNSRSDEVREQCHEQRNPIVNKLLVKEVEGDKRKLYSMEFTSVPGDAIWEGSVFASLEEEQSQWQLKTLVRVSMYAPDQVCDVTKDQAKVRNICLKGFFNGYSFVYVKKEWKLNVAYCTLV